MSHLWHKFLFAQILLAGLSICISLVANLIVLVSEHIARMSLVIGDPPEPEGGISSASLSDEEGDAFFPKQHPDANPVGPMKPKQTNVVCKVALLLCPYLFAVMFIISFFLFHHTLLSAPVVTVVNTFSGKDSFILNLSSFTDSKGSEGNLSFSNLTDNQYNYPNYLFKLALFDLHSCPTAKYYICDSVLDPLVRQEVNLPFSIDPLLHKTILITNVSSSCEVAISWHLRFPAWGLSAVCLILLFLFGFDISHCIYRRCFKKKYE